MPSGLYMIMQMLAAPFVGLCVALQDTLFFEKCE